MNSRSSEKFLLASGFLITILLVWSSLWITVGQIYSANNVENLSTVGFGVVSIYWALLFLIIAFALTIFKHKVGKFAILSIGVGLTITVLEVLQSLITTIWKLVTDVEFWKPLPIGSKLIPTALPWNLIPYIVLPALLLLMWIALVYWLPTKRYFDPENLFKES